MMMSEWSTTRDDSVSSFAAVHDDVVVVVVVVVVVDRVPNKCVHILWTIIGEFLRTNAIRVVPVV